MTSESDFLFRCYSKPWLREVSFLAAISGSYLGRRTEADLEIPRWMVRNSRHANHLRMRSASTPSVNMPATAATASRVTTSSIKNMAFAFIGFSTYRTCTIRSPLASVPFGSPPVQHDPLRSRCPLNKPIAPAGRSRQWLLDPPSRSFPRCFSAAPAPVCRKAHPLGCRFDPEAPRFQSSCWYLSTAARTPKPRTPYQTAQQT